MLTIIRRVGITLANVVCINKLSALISFNVTVDNQWLNMDLGGCSNSFNSM